MTREARVVWREPAQAARIRADLAGSLDRSALTHWLNLDRVTANGAGPERVAKATTDCGIAVTGRINDPYADNGLVMPSDTPVTCSGCLEAQGRDVVADATRHLRQMRTHAVAGGTADGSGL